MELSILIWPTAVDKGYTQSKPCGSGIPKRAAYRTNGCSFQLRTEEEMRNEKRRRKEREKARRKQNRRECNNIQNTGKFSVFILAVRPRKCLSLF
jgi:hypothetical protein